MAKRTRIVWVDELPQSKGAWWERVEPLAERPGTWAMIYKAKDQKPALTIASMLRTRRHSYPEGNYEFEAIDGKVYGRLVVTTKKTKTKSK